MTRSQKFFRTLWRINAVLISLAAALIVIGLGYLLIEEVGRTVHHVRETVIAKRNNPEEGLDLKLGSFTLVAGTDILRAELSDQKDYGQGSFSSSGPNYITRNIFFVSKGQKSGHWLLPDNQHCILKQDDITETKDSKSERTIATAAIISPLNNCWGTGSLIVFDTAGERTLQVAKQVSTMHWTNYADGKITVLFERSGHPVFVTVDSKTFAKLEEHEIEVPELKPHDPTKTSSEDHETAR